MTIYGFSGKPGAGKSYSAVEHCIVPALKQDRTVYHNMLLKEAQLRIVAGDKGQLIYFAPDVTPGELVEGCPPGALIVIDESLRYWPAGTKANKVPANELEFFTKHRHNVGEDGRASDIVLICQDFGTQCAAFIRELIDVTYYSKKLSKFGLTKSYRLSIYDGCVKGDRPPESKLIKTSTYSYKSSIYSCYVSHTNSRTGLAGEELKDANVSIFKNDKVVGGALALAALPFALWLSAASFMKIGPEKPESTAPLPQSEPAAVPPARSLEPAKPQTPTPAPKRIESADWRLAGRILIDNLQYYVIEGLNGPRYLSDSACRFDESRNMTCELDGQLVAEWTGPRAANFDRLTSQFAFTPPQPLN